MRVAIQGEEGSYHHQVTLGWFGDDVQTIAAETFGDVFGALNRHEADAAIVATENSLYGSINEVLDLIEAHRYPIIGETYLRIQQQLITLPGATLQDIEKVYSHPVALAQCEHFLDVNCPAAERIEYHDTAASVEFIKQLGDPSCAAIASRVAAELHEMPILTPDIEDNKANFTRFLVLSPVEKVVKNADKTSLVLTTDHTPGSVARILSIFADNDINLARLQSRPIIGQPWKYRFYLDVEAAGEKLDRIIDIIRLDGASVTVLGSYVAAKC